MPLVLDASLIKALTPVTIGILTPSIGAVLNIFTIRRNKLWYKRLRKPVWTPPGDSFRPIWHNIYSLTGYASFMIWRDGGGFSGPAKLPLILYGGQLALNWAWSPIFFGGHKLKLAFYEILALDVAAAGTACAFYKISRSAGLMFIPYMMWLGLATTLTYRIWKDNPEEEDEVIHRND